MLNLPINSFPELIKLQEGLLMRLATVALQELELVNANDITSLLQLLGRKYQLLEEYDEIRKALKSHEENNPDTRKWKNESEKNNAKISIEHSKKLLDEIMLNIQQSINELETKKDNMKNEIQRFDRVAHSRLGYAKTSGDKIFIKHFDIEK
jgi:hypothetical protein